MRLFWSKPTPGPSPTASDAARTLGRHAIEKRRKAVRARCREICAATGQTIPTALEN